MAAKSTEAPNLVGKTKVEIALLVKSGALKQADAEKFVVERERRKFLAAIEKVA